MLRPLLRSGFAIALCASAVWSGFELGCAPAASPPPDEIVSTPGQNVAGGTQGSTTSASPIATPAKGGCDEFGTLNASSLVGKLAQLDGSTMRETLALTVDNRPTRTKASIIVNGDPTALVGQTVALGVGGNADAFTCNHCVLVAVGCTASSCAQAAYFFPRSGSISLNAVASSDGQPFSGTLSDVELRQVTLDVTKQVMTPVEGGACVHVASLTFAATMTATGTIGGGTSVDAGQNVDTDAAGPGDKGGLGIGGLPQPAQVESDAAGTGGTKGTLDQDSGANTYLDQVFL